MGRSTGRPLGVAVAITAAVVAVLVGALLVQWRSNAERADAAVSFAVPTPTARTGVPSAAFIGDSYSAGTGATGFNTRFTTLVSAYEGWSSNNFAYGGTGYLRAVTKNGAVGCGVNVCPRYGDVISKVARYNPTIVVVSGGRNDVLEDMPDVTVAISEFYRDLRRELPKATIYSTSPIWDDRPPPAQLKQIQAAVRTAVESVGGTYIDIGEPLQGKPKLVAKDGVHPNNLGHAAIAHAVEVALSAATKS